MAGNQGLLSRTCLRAQGSGCRPGSPPPMLLQLLQLLPVYSPPLQDLPTVGRNKDSESADLGLLPSLSFHSYKMEIIIINVSQCLWKHNEIIYNT